MIIIAFNRNFSAFWQQIYSSKKREYGCILRGNSD